MRIAIVSRIFWPEPAAASFRLQALAEQLLEEGHRVSVLTVTRPKRGPGETDSKPNPAYPVKRWPVLRDRSGYVRGYVQYLSFDLPLFFRLLLGPRYDLLIVEPPPTTAFITRMATGIRRMRYAYYAADIWSDASSQIGRTPSWVVQTVRWIERIALNGAQIVLSVNDGVSERVGELAGRARVRTIGNGVDTRVFKFSGERRDDAAYAVYTGTVSEWQGAEVFVRALESVRRSIPKARLVFLGQGSDWAALQSAARRLPADAVEFVSTVPAEEAAVWLRSAVVSLASIRPDAGYSFALPTKLFASWACGTPAVFTGPADGQAAQFMLRNGRDAPLGEHCQFEVDSVAEALTRAFEHPIDDLQRRDLARWAAEHVSLEAVAIRVSGVLTEEMS